MIQHGRVLPIKGSGIDILGSKFSKERRAEFIKICAEYCITFECDKIVSDL